MMSPLKNLKTIGLVCFFCAIQLNPLALWAADIHTLPEPTLVIPAPPQIDAKSYILIDQASNYIIAEHDVDQRVEPASLTKMMTVYVVDHALQKGKLKPTDDVQISEKAWKTAGSKMFVAVNTTVPVSELMRGIIVQSGNDASIAIAEHLAGSESAFAELMNFYAKQLGMTNTHFVNATGLPEENHYTSARDMAILAKALIRDFPESYKLYSEKEFVYQNIKQENRNRLLWKNELVDGIKTGFTDAAGYCLVASGKKDNMRLISVVMGTNSDHARTEESNKLLSYGFRFYETRQLFQAGKPLKTSRIWMGTQNEINLGLGEDLYITIGQGQYEHIKTAIKINTTIKAPTHSGEAVGTLAVEFNNKPLIERPIIALNEVKEGGFFSRMYDTVALNFHTMINKFMP